jgi:hypothetical protein
MIMILLMWLSCIPIEVLQRWGVIRVLYIGQHPLNGWIFMVAGGLFLFALLIFAPLYRKFGVQSLRRIEKGKHFPVRTHFPIMVNLRRVFSIEKIFNFDKSCLYDFNDNDEYDKNKLFGLSFAFWPRIKTRKWLACRKANKDVVLPWFSFLGLVVIKPQHWSSVRFTWNTVNKVNKIDIYPYVYDKGVRKRISESLGLCNIGEDYHFKLHVDKRADRVIFVKSHTANGSNVYEYAIKDTGIFYNYLDVYFGGNKKAPHDMIIQEGT